jgi:hypothetical protein
VRLFLIDFIIKIAWEKFNNQSWAEASKGARRRDIFLFGFFDQSALSPFISQFQNQNL